MIDANAIAGIPKCSWSNPIWYRGYRIYPGDWTPWEFQHDDFDPTPLYAFDGPSDHRAGHGKDVQDCRDQIDEIEGLTIADE